MNGKHHPRAGALLLTCLVAMAVLAVVFAVVTKQVLAQRQLAQQRHRQLQADWLAKAGVELAAARLLSDPAAFETEHKNLAADAKVHVKAEKAGADAYDIHAEAEIDAGDGRAVRRAVQFRFRRLDAQGIVRLEAAPAQ